jgi:hypothetical protein
MVCKARPTDPYGSGDWPEGASLGDEYLAWSDPGLTMVGFWRINARRLTTEYLVVVQAAARTSRR